MSKRDQPDLDGRLDGSKFQKVEANGTPEGGRRAPTPPPPPPPPPQSLRIAQIPYTDRAPLRNMLRAWEHRTPGDLVKMVEVTIPAEHVSKDNKRVKSRQLWGDLVYTWDSDVVAALMHIGCITATLAAAPPTVATFHALLRLDAPLEKYPSKVRYVKSRQWCGSAEKLEGCSFTVERCWLVTRAATVVELPACIDELPAPVPTLQPLSSDRTITTRTAGTKSKISQEVSVQFNLCNEPWLKYTLAAVSDKGPTPEHFTSARLHTEVLLLETARDRFQITYNSAASNSGSKVYSLARCLQPLTLAGMRRCGMPLPADGVEVLEDKLDWEELQWGVSALHVRERDYVLKRMHFMPISKPCL